MFHKYCSAWVMLSCVFHVNSVNCSNDGQQKAACNVFGTCSQLCTPKLNAVNCSCADGFKLKENEWGCDPIDGNWKVFYNYYDESWILSMWQDDLKSKTNYTIPNGTEGRGITYDARNNVIYSVRKEWRTSFSIFRTSLQNWSSVEIVVGTDLQESHYLAFDWTTGNIYFADTDYSRISVCKNDSNVCVVLIDESVNQPQHIALHPASGLLFWTEKGANPCIMRAGMDGSQPLRILSFDSPWISELTVDQANERIYFVVAHSYAIHSSRFDGSDQKIAISDAGVVDGLSVFGDRLIWGDNSYGAGHMLSADKFNGSNKKKHISHIKGIYDLVVFHVANQPATRTSPCLKANCSHICTIGPQENFKCVCPPGMQLVADRKTCTESDNTAKLVVASKGTFKTMIFGSIEKETWEVTNLDDKITSIADIVYNPVNHTLILSDSASKRIYEYSLSSEKLSVLVDGHLDRVQSVDIDVVGENLYWADSGKDMIEVMSLRTSARGIIFKNLTNIRELVVVSETRSLYVLSYTNLYDAEGSKIAKLLLTGGNFSIVRDAHRPIAISYQRQLGSIFWVESTQLQGYKDLKFTFNVNAYWENGSRFCHVEGIQGGPPSDIVNFGNLVYYSYIDFIQVFSVRSNRSPYHPPQFDLGSFYPNSRYRTTRNLDAKLTIIDRNLSILEHLLAHHDCGIKNPKKLNCSHLCLLTGEKLVGLCSCPEGMILDGDKLTCTSSSTCLQNQFTCRRSTMCIPKNYICDGKSDCDNGEDEINCRETTCTPQHFKCATSGKCIPYDWLCDGEHDCVGGDDELNCTRSCEADREFTCENTKNCIPQSSWCDGVVDCLEDESDEQDCEVTSCGDHQLLCGNGLCIEKEVLCDGMSNCDDAQDEVNCTGAMRKSAGEGIPRSPVHNNNGTVFDVVIVVLLTLIVIIFPLGIIIVRWSIHKVCQPVRPVVIKRIRGGGGVEEVVDDITELTLAQNVDGECMDTGLSMNNIATDSCLDGCPMENMLSDSRDFEVKSVAVAVDTQDRGHHFVSFSDMEKLIPSTAARNNEVDTRPVRRNSQS